MVLKELRAPLVCEERPVPEPGLREVLVRVDACGSGLTVHNAVTGTSSARLPVVLGHEIAGEVVALGSAAEGLSLGDYVTSYFYLFCGRCRHCLSGREPLCIEQPGYIGRQIDGGYAEYLVAPDRNLLIVPSALRDRYSPAEIAVICDAVATPLKIVRRAALRQMETCVVIGAAGGIGVHMVQVAKAAGALVVAVDQGDAKVAAACDAGAHEGVDALAGDTASRIRDLVGGDGADVVVDLVGSSPSLEVAPAVLGSGGRLVIVGNTSGSEVTLAARTMLMKEQAVMGSRYVARQDVHDALAMVERGHVRPIVPHVFPLEKVNEAHELVASGQSIGRVALTMSPR